VILVSFAFRALFIAVFTILVNTALPQDEGERQLWDAEFLKKRAPARPGVTAKKPSYRKVTPSSPSTTASADSKAVGEVVGVTVWKLRRTESRDSQDSRLLLEEEPGGDKSEWTPERTELETAFAVRDRVRLSIESPRDGYLYVINRELYVDGSTSAPYLIFPMLRNRNGDNSVKAGKVINLPKTAFRLEPTRPDYRGEILTMIIASQPIAEIKVANGMVELDKTLVAQMEEKWKAPVERYEMNGSAGKPLTKAEKEAGEEGSRLLTQEDDLPQTLFRVIPKPGNPLLVSIQLKVNPK